MVSQDVNILNTDQPLHLKWLSTKKKKKDHILYGSTAVECPEEAKL